MRRSLDLHMLFSLGRQLAPRLIVILAVVLILLKAVPAAAHAELVRTIPEVNSVVARAPVLVELYFSEALEPNFSQIKVLNSDGQPVDQQDSKVDPAQPTRLTVSLRSLVDGVYTVSWRVVSAVDGHETSGSFPFVVGQSAGAAPTAASAQTSFSLSLTAVVLKWLLFLTSAPLAAYGLFLSLVWQPALAASGLDLPAGVRQPPAWGLAQRIALAGLFGALALSLLALVGQASGQELGLPWNPLGPVLLAGTRLGVLWLARLAAASLLAWFTLGTQSAWKRLAAPAAGLALLGAVSFGSHAAAGPAPLLPILLDWLHLAGMAAWLGGLVYLFSGLRSLRRLEPNQHTRLAAQVVRRFSVLGIAAVSLLALTGLYAGIQRVGGLEQLLTTPYGQALLVKLGFFGALIAAAGLNLLVFSPALNRPAVEEAGAFLGMRTAARLVRSVGIEIGLLAGLLLAASLMTLLPPARLPGRAVLGGSATVDDLSLELAITPGIVGQNTFSLQVAAGGQPLAVAKSVVLRLTAQSADLPPTDIQLAADGSGTYSASGSYLSLPGSWQAQAVVRRPDQFDVYANFDLQVPPPGSDQTSPAQNNWRLAAAALLAVSALGMSQAFLALFPSRRRVRLRLAGAAALALLICALFVLLMPSSSPAGLANPVPPNQESVQAGLALYSLHCAGCHGAAGHGDGPVGLTLIPRPADLSLHAVPGVHSDAQLYQWIGAGFPGSPMPAYEAVLSDSERWNLVNYLRTLAPR